MSDSTLLLPQETADRSLARLEYIRLEPQFILNIGLAASYCGAILQQQFPNAQIDSREVSTGFDELAQIPSHSVDFFYSNLYFPWLHNLPVWFAQLRRILKPTAMLLFTTLGPDTLRELRQSFVGIDKYAHTTSFTDMHDLGDMLLQQQFENPVMDMELLSLQYPDVDTLLQDIKSVPVRRQFEHQRLGLMTPRQWQHMQQNYEKQRRENNLPVSCELIYGHAWVAEGSRTSQLNPEGEVVFSLDQLQKRGSR